MLKKGSRKMLMVERTFQKKILSRLLLLSIFGVFFMSFIIYILANENTERTFFSIHQGVRSTWEALFPAIFIGGSFTLLVTTVSVFYITLYQSHRIGGPIYRFKQVMDRLSEGDYNVTINLRREDYLSELAESLDGAIRHTRDRICVLKKEAILLHETIEDTHYADAACEKKILEVRQRAKTIRNILENFNVDEK